MTYEKAFPKEERIACNLDGMETVPVDPALICEDSREVKEGALFFAMQGEKSDGWDYIPTLSDSGCTVVTDREPPHDYTGRWLLVKNCRRANAVFWSRFYGDPGEELTVTAVTGTNGKTTVTRMLGAIAGEAQIPAAVIGTLGAQIGREFYPTMHTTPAPRELYRLLRMAADDRVKQVFIEASSQGLCYEKFAPLSVALGIFTGLSEDHLDYHRDMTSYAAAKALLFKKCKRALLNADSPFAETMRAALPKGSHCHLCSESSRFADFMAQNIEDRGIDGIAYDLIGENEAIHIGCPVPGSFTVMNSLLAAAGARLLGFGCEEIALALRRFAGVRGRMEQIALPGADFLAFVDYAHTPDALRLTLRSLRECLTQGGRLLLVFGCGGDREKEKRPIMGGIAAEYADYIILTEDNSRGERTEDIIGQIMGGINRKYAAGHLSVLPDRSQAIAWAVGQAGKGDILLLAGKGHENYTVSDGSGTRRPGADDHTVLRDAWERFRRTREEIG